MTGKQRRIRGYLEAQAKLSPAAIVEKLRPPQSGQAEQTEP
jgi:hypothetical protein